VANTQPHPFYLFQNMSDGINDGFTMQCCQSNRPKPTNNLTQFSLKYEHTLITKEK